jgi:hypothetical protein
VNTTNDDVLIKFMAYVLDQTSFLHNESDPRNEIEKNDQMRQCFEEYSGLIKNKTDIKNSIMFNCMYKDYSVEVKNLIWLEYYRIALFMSDQNTYPRIEGNENCVKRTLTSVLYVILIGDTIMKMKEFIKRALKVMQE